MVYYSCPLAVFNYFTEECVRLVVSAHSLPPSPTAVSLGVWRTNSSKFNPWHFQLKILGWQLMGKISIGYPGQMLLIQEDGPVASPGERRLHMFMSPSTSKRHFSGGSRAMGESLA